MSKDELKKAYNAVVDSLTWSLNDARMYYDELNSTIEEAIKLRGQGIPFDHNQNPIKAIDSFVDIMPSGDETGNYYAIDLGGTNLRAVCVTLSGQGVTGTTQKEQNIRELNVTPETPKGILDKKTPACMMFDTIANLVKDLMTEAGDDLHIDRNIAFTFSFPIVQHSLANGELLNWTKEFETGQATHDPVEKQDVSELLNAAFRRKGMKVTVGAVANDTVGTLLSAGYENNATLPACRVGIILGTGFNIASTDPKARLNNYTGHIINHECGNYNGGQKFASVMDIELDYSTSDKGKQLAEKMISGAYLGELCRLSILKVFQWRCPQNVWKMGSCQTPKAALIYADNTTGFKVTTRVVKEVFDWDISDWPEAEKRMIYKLIGAVFDRSATIAALMTAVFADRTRHLQPALGGVTVGVDGSLYLKNEKYRKTFQKTLNKILGPRANLIHIVTASDGSGKGAAVIASCLK